MASRRFYHLSQAPFSLELRQPQQLLLLKTSSHASSPPRKVGRLEESHSRDCARAQQTRWRPSPRSPTRVSCLAASAPIRRKLDRVFTTIGERGPRTWRRSSMGMRASPNCPTPPPGSRRNGHNSWPGCRERCRFQLEGTPAVCARGSSSMRARCKQVMINLFEECRGNRGLAAR